MNVYSDSLRFHEKLKGKIEVKSKVFLSSKKNVSLAYTPGVAEPCRKIAGEPWRVFGLTLKSNSLAVVSDGSSVLGLGDIGALAAIPVMEGKAALFKEFAGIDAFPICIGSNDVNEIVRTVELIAPVFGAVNLEDISAPRCFEVEERLQGIGIPVMHDDQHGTAVVVLAGIINAVRVAGKRLEDLNIVISGAGAAGHAIASLLLCLGVDKRICTSVKNICVVDSHGIIFEGRQGLDKFKLFLAKATNKRKIKGTLKEALVGADVFVGVSRAGLVSKGMIKSMALKPVVFAMANPEPEIGYSDAVSAGAFVVGTGRSDLPNQVNNALAFPGIFRGSLDAGSLSVNNEMKVAAVHAIAGYVKKPSVKKILPHIYDKKFHLQVALAVKKAAVESGNVREK